MKIINRSKDTILADNAIIAQTFISRLRGLLARREFPKGEALILKPCDSIHTFFMHFPIDVLFVDSNSKVIKAINSMPPFRLTGIYFRSAFAIELPAGTIKATSTSSGDVIHI